jgi:DivIVA domain-containing protein
LRGCPDVAGPRARRCQVPITPEEIAGKKFLELDGGYDQGEVRAFLKGLAKEHGALIERLADSDSRAEGSRRRDNPDPGRGA